MLHASGIQGSVRDDGQWRVLTDLVAGDVEAAGRLETFFSILIARAEELAAEG